MMRPAEGALLSEAALVEAAAVAAKEADVVMTWIDVLVELELVTATTEAEVLVEELKLDDVDELDVDVGSNEEKEEEEEEVEEVEEAEELVVLGTTRDDEELEEMDVVEGMILELELLVVRGVLEVAGSREVLLSASVLSSSSSVEVGEVDVDSSSSSLLAEGLVVPPPSCRSST